MRLDWNATRMYDDVGDNALLEEAVRDALAQVPREHRRLLEAIRVWDRDPKGVALGLYRQDHTGAHIELYLAPHIEDALQAPDAVRLWVLRLNLAQTLFHEFGHHVTLCLNRRADPARKAVRVTQTREKWAEAYVTKRLQALCDTWLARGGAATTALPEERPRLLAALRWLHWQGRIHLRAQNPGTVSGSGPGTNLGDPSSKTYQQ